MSRMTTGELRTAFESGSSRQRIKASWELCRNLEEHLPWFASRQLRSLKLIKKSDGWLVIVNAQYGKKDQVCFTEGDNLEECFVNIAHGLVFGLLKWKEDNWRTIRSDKS